MDAIQVMPGEQGIFQVLQFVGSKPNFPYEVGDWIVRNAHGQLRAMNPHTFHRLFEACSW